jgi:hypothetical protein
MKIKQLSILFAITGTLFLYFLSTLSKPVIIDLERISEFENKKIVTQGFVKEYFSTKYGSQLITIQNNTSCAVVYVEGSTNVEYGDKIRVTGEVQKYLDDWEIILDDKRNLEILQKWNGTSHPLWEIAQNPVFYLDLNVNITGFVDSIYDSFFYLRDLETNHTIPVYYDRYLGSEIHPGKEVVVYGRFKFDEKQMRYILEFFDENHGVFVNSEV